METELMTTDIKNILRQVGLTSDYIDAATESESIYLAYDIGTPVTVEIIAPNLADTLLRLDPEDQTEVISVIARLVPEVGDHEVIVDEQGGKRQRGARVIRMRSDDEQEVSLLITR